MMRLVVAAVVLAGAAAFGMGSAEARGMPGPWMNPHPPYFIAHSYWVPCGWGIAGPTDTGLRPVNGIGPPPFGPRPRVPPPPHGGAGASPGAGDFCTGAGCFSPDGNSGGNGCNVNGCDMPYYWQPNGHQPHPGFVWHRYARSPRDFFMAEPRR